jgi:hypothetical protein
MKKICIALGTILALLSLPVMAQSTAGLMFGGKVGLYKPADPDNETGVNIAAVLSKPMVGNISWEADLSFSVTDAKAGSSDFDIDSVAGYAVYRTEGNTHIKAKLGVAYWDSNSADESDFNLAAGIGIGFRTGRGILDIEYTQIGHIADYITVGYIIPF